MTAPWPSVSTPSSTFPRSPRCGRSRAPWCTGCSSTSSGTTARVTAPRGGGHRAGPGLGRPAVGPRVPGPRSPAGGSRRPAHRGGRAGQQLLRPGGSERDHSDRHRAAPRSPPGWSASPRHHRSAGSDARRRAGGHRLQDRPGPVARLRTVEAHRRPHLRPVVPGGTRAQARPGQAAPPQGAHRHHRRTLRAGASWPAGEDPGRVVGHRAGLRAGGLPTPHLAAVQLLPIPGLLPGLRWRPRPGGRGPRD